ncbi:hypothetical protein BDY21DRAFT_205158 [Lineolata rhizophorae]|uniref:Uncharacterized protein n=1 Tax=Lineolata rhizophorae TaxID=578093 RepID=A0A6A6P3R1_9PEZI|nr:hypothetical protein BDY21DRAFT_205158 [Lineolata rhizophorae]
MWFHTTRPPGPPRPRATRCDQGPSRRSAVALSIRACLSSGPSGGQDCSAPGAAKKRGIDPHGREKLSCSRRPAPEHIRRTASDRDARPKRLDPWAMAHKAPAVRPGRSAGTSPVFPTGAAAATFPKQPRTPLGAAVKLRGRRLYLRLGRSLCPRLPGPLG